MKITTLDLAALTLSTGFSAIPAAALITVTGSVILAAVAAVPVFCGCMLGMAFFLGRR